MNLLALDTSSVACTVALQLGTEILTRHQERAREHTRLLMPMLREVLQEAGISLRDLDAIVLGNGPGSFIGMRIAASVAQGLAHGSGCEIIPVSSMAAVAANVFANEDTREVVVAQDAHMHEVYLGLYHRSAAGLPTLVGEERLHGLEAISELDEINAQERIAAGYAWRRYPQFWTANQSLIGADSQIHCPRAEFLLALASTGLVVAPERVRPAYLREKVAQEPDMSAP